MVPPSERAALEARTRRRLRQRCRSLAWETYELAGELAALELSSVTAASLAGMGSMLRVLGVALEQEAQQLEAAHRLPPQEPPPGVIHERPKPKVASTLDRAVANLERLRGNRG